MIKLYLTSFTIFIVLTMQAAQYDANIFGDVQSNGEHIPFVNIFIENTTIGTTTDITGHYMLINLPIGDHIISAKAVGYKKQSHKVTIVEGKTLEVNFELEEEVLVVEEIVVTGTKTFKRSTESAVIVNVLDGRTMEAIQVNTLSEGLSFQPGLRLETDCQTCNYSQLRMNGLGGSYSQILINGRSVFSPLTGLYGLEQIPSNMIDRIEVVRGGGSALYGSSAIGGTVNVITKIPTVNAYQLSVNNTIINGAANDNILNGSINVLSQKRNAGVSFFASRRDRQSYDHNGDGFSEMPHLKNNSFGFTSFIEPAHNQKLEVSLSSLYEYRYGGEITDKPAHMAQQSEERTHNVLMGGIDYEIDFEHSALILYTAGQSTGRKHYTGIIPDLDDQAYTSHFFDPPYGNTKNYTWQTGIQYNLGINNFLGGTNLVTLGSEYVYDYVNDEIEAYNYLIDQQTKTLGTYVQSDWKINKGLTLLSGLRFDKHNFVEKLILNPRFSMLYRLKDRTQFRASWSTGFRAPQAFDSDMHIAFSGGGISRTALAPDLKEERSHSFSGSVNYDYASEKYIYGFTLEGFYTQLNDAFVLEELGEDDFGIIYEKRNASGSTVKGITLELRSNYNRVLQLETGITLQSSLYNEAVSYSEDLPQLKEYLRTPNDYGYFTLTYTPDSKLNAALSGVYTGKMKVLHSAGAPEQPINDEYFEANPFIELNLRLSYKLPFYRLDNGLEFFGGIKNITNSFQNNFDSGKNRDSGFVYGPAAPRSIFFGVKIYSL